MGDIYQVRTRGDGAYGNVLPIERSGSSTPLLPDEIRLWAALQVRSGGIWGGCVYDVNHLVEALED